jgi:myo-inositol catabolism protein IolH
MRIALLTDVFKHAPLTEALAAIRRAGFDAIELNACYNWDPHIDFASEQAEREVALLARLLEQYRLTLAAVAVYPNIASLDAGERQRAVRMCCRAIDLLSPLGCPLLTLMPYGSNLLPYAPQEQALVASLQAICARAERCGMRVAIEVYPGNFIEESATLLALIERLGLPSLGYLLCVAHVAALGEDVLATYQAAKPRLFHIHVSDTPLRTLDHKHLLPGLGEVDLAALARALRADRYDGTLTLQIYSHEDTAEQSSAEGLKLMRALFG